MSGRIILFGATGYTGELTARALVARGARPLLVARSATRVRALADELGGLEHAVADVGSPVSLAAVVQRGDVLVSTVGPFARLGGPVVEAALASGAHYIDSTGEPGFIARVFRTWGPQADAVGCALLPAMGYDYVPGNLAAALALNDAGTAVTRVDVGYFGTGDGGAGSFSGGTKASVAGAVLEPGIVLRDGRLVEEPGGRHLRSFQVYGRSWQGVSIGATEHFTLSALAPGLTDVRVYAGWAGRASRAVQLLSYPLEAALALPGVRSGAAAVLSRTVQGSTGGPDGEERSRTGTLIVAEALDPVGNVLGRAVLQGVNAYDFTAAFLAWAAEVAAAGGIRGSGALGPIEAFGVDAVAVGVVEAGLRLVDEVISE